MNRFLLSVIWLLAVAFSIQAVHGQNRCRDPWDGGKMNLCLQVNIHWSMQDVGVVEPKVVRRFEGVEKRWPGSHIVNATSRAAAMLKAIEAAKAGFDKKSYRIAYACQ